MEQNGVVGRMRALKSNRAASCLHLSWLCALGKLLKLSEGRFPKGYSPSSFVIIDGREKCLHASLARAESWSQKQMSPHPDPTTVWGRVEGGGGRGEDGVTNSQASVSHLSGFEVQVRMK